MCPRKGDTGWATCGDRRGALGHASATTCALLGERVPECTRGPASAGHTERALSAVDIEYARRRPADDPVWAYWLDEDEITVMAERLLCGTEAAQPSDSPARPNTHLGWLKPRVAGCDRAVM